jgi:hypothetical protein
MFKRKKNVDHYGSRTLLNICHIPKHLYFSVYSTFKERAEIAVNESEVKYG